MFNYKKEPELSVAQLELAGDCCTNILAMDNSRPSNGPRFKKVAKRAACAAAKLRRKQQSEQTLSDEHLVSQSAGSGEGTLQSVSVWSFLEQNEVLLLASLRAALIKQTIETTKLREDIAFICSECAEGCAKLSAAAPHVVRDQCKILLRHLRSNDNDVDAACANVTQTIIKRHEAQISSLVLEYEPSEFISHLLETGKVLCLGFDPHQLCPVFFLRAAAFDALKSASDMIDLFVVMIELAPKVFPSADQISLLVDADALNVSTQKTLFPEILGIFRCQYPQRLGCLAVLRPPSALKYSWKFVFSKMVTAKTRKKTFFCNSVDDLSEMLSSDFLAQVRMLMEDRMQHTSSRNEADLSMPWLKASAPAGVQARAHWTDPWHMPEGYLCMPSTDLLSIDNTSASHKAKSRVQRKPNARLLVVLSVIAGAAAFVVWQKYHA